MAELYKVLFLLACLYAIIIMPIVALIGNLIIKVLKLNKKPRLRLIKGGLHEDFKKSKIQ